MKPLAALAAACALAAAATPAAPAARPAAVPRILSASISPTQVSAGTTLHAVVRTTPGIVSVVAYAAGGSLPITRVGPGLFEDRGIVPQLPPSLHGDIQVTFVGTDAGGKTARRAVGLRVR